MPDPKDAPGKAAGGIKGGLTRKAGPLPVWGWAAIVAGGYVAYTFLRGGSGATGTEAGVPVDLGGAGGGGSGGGASGLDTAALQDAIDRLAAAANAIPTPAGGSGGGGSGGSGSGAIGSGGDSGNVSSLYGLTGGNALLAKYPALAQFNTDQFGTIDFGSPAGIPGFSAVSDATAQEWIAKLGGNFMNVGNPDPAELLAQWQFHQQYGLGGTALTQRDLEEGMAFATAYAQAAGVTAEQLAEAQRRLVQQGGIEGSSGFVPDVAYAYRRANAGLADGIIPGNAAEYIASLRAYPGVNTWTGLTNAELADQLAKNWGVNDAGASVNGAPPTVSSVPQINVPGIPAPTVSQPSPVASVPSVTTADALNAIRSRYPSLNWEGIKAQYDRNIARGITNAQMVT